MDPEYSPPIIGTCVYCGDPATDRDHVLPRSRGGRNTLPSCHPCNCSKNNRTPGEWVAAMYVSELAGRGNPRRHLIVAHLKTTSTVPINWEEVSEAIRCYVEERATAHDRFLIHAAALLGAPAFD